MRHIFSIMIDILTVEWVLLIRKLKDFSSSDDDSFVIADHKEDFGDSEVENRVPNPVSI